MSRKPSPLGSAKKIAFKAFLEPAGFVKGRHLYIRNRDGQIHGIEFQASNFGRRYYVNLAFHYDFLPPRLPLMNNIDAHEATDFDIIDFMFHTRMEHLVAGAQSHWYYDENLGYN